MDQVIHFIRLLQPPARRIFLTWRETHALHDCTDCNVRRYRRSLLSRVHTSLNNSQQRLGLCPTVVCGDLPWMEWKNCRRSSGICAFIMRFTFASGAFSRKPFRSMVGASANTQDSGSHVLSSFPNLPTLLGPRTRCHISPLPIGDATDIVSALVLQVLEKSS